MGLEDLLDPFLSGADNVTPDVGPVFSGLDLASGTGGVDFASVNFDTLDAPTKSILEQLGITNRQALMAAVGAGGPLVGLLGQLLSGGQGPTQSGTSQQSQSTNQTGFSNNQQTNAGSQSGFNNTTFQPSLDPAAQSAEQRLTSMLGQSAGGAQSAYNSGLGMLQQLAGNQMGALASQGPLGSPQTTPSAAQAGGFPTQLPTDYNPGIGNLIKQAFGSFTGDLASQAITNARGRGFAGGADLLGSAAAPMMGQSLAQVPAMEAKAYLDHVLQAYDLQSQNAGREAGANASLENAATAALGPGITKYGIDRSANTQQVGQLTSLLQALMGPQANLMQANTNLLNVAPRGSAQNTLSGGQSQSSLSGATQSGSQSNSLTNGATSGTTTTPLPSVIGTGLQNAGVGAATGLAAQANADAASNFQKSLLGALAGRNGTS